MAKYLFVSDKGTISSDNHNFKEVKIKKFFRNLNRRINSTDTYFNQDTKSFTLTYCVKVVNKSNYFYEISYYGDTFLLDISSAVLYYPILKKNLDELVNKTSKNMQIEEVFNYFESNGLHNSDNVDDMNIYFKRLKHYSRQVIPFSILLLLPLILTVLTFMAFVANSTVPWVILAFILTFSFTCFYMTPLISDYDFWEFKVSFAVIRKIMAAKKWLKSIEKGITPIVEKKHEEVKEEVVGNSKNADVNVCERMVINAFKLTCKSLVGLSRDDSLKMLHYLKIIIDDYNAKRETIPKFTPKARAMALESKYATDAISQIQALNDRINDSNDHSYEYIPEVVNCVEISEFLSHSLNEGKEPKAKDGKVLSRGLGNGTSR